MPFWRTLFVCPILKSCVTSVLFSCMALACGGLHRWVSTCFPPKMPEVSSPYFDHRPSPALPFMEGLQRVPSQRLWRSADVDGLVMSWGERKTTTSQLLSPLSQEKVQMQIKDNIEENCQGWAKRSWLDELEWGMAESGRPWWMEVAAV